MGLPRRKEDLSDPRPTVCCPVAPCFDERPCLHPAFFTSLEATVFRARLIRASNASEPNRRREGLWVPGPSVPLDLTFASRTRPPR